MAEDVRRFRTLTPLDFGAMLATAKGVHVTQADASAQELREWQASGADNMSAQRSVSLLWKSLDERQREAKVSFRDKKMVTRLGEAALKMEVQRTNDPPRLAFNAGIGHKGVADLLDTLQVPFEVHDLSPDINKRDRADTTRLALRALIPFIDSPIKAHEKRWIAHAREQASRQYRQS